jgi:hypothetical protein
MAIFIKQNIQAIVVEEPSGEFVGHVTNVPEIVVIAGDTKNAALKDFDSWCDEHLRLGPPQLLTKEAQLARIQGIVSNFLETGHTDLAKEVLEDIQTINNPLLSEYAQKQLQQLALSKNKY